jgi:HK97 family phage portal protein
MISIMKLLDTLKSYFPDRLKDISLKLSQLAQLWDKGLDVNGTRKGRPSQPYSQVEWVWICVNLLIDTCRTVPLMLSNANDEVLESGPLYNYVYSKQFSRLFQETLGFYILYREVYWITLDSSGMTPTSILVVGPNSCRPVIEKGVLVGYALQIGGKETILLLEDVYVIKNFNPYDTNRGCGPLNAGEMSISTAYQAMQYNESLLANGARLSVGLTVPQGVQLSPEEIQKLKREFSSKHAGAANAGKVLLMQGITDVKTFSQTMADLQMVDMSKFTANTICALFNVPPEVVGLNNEAQYAHGPATQRLILYGVSPLLDAISTALDEGIIQKYKFKSVQNKFVDFAKSAIAATRFPLRCRALYRRAKAQAVMAGQSIFAWFDIASHPAIQEMMRDQIAKIIPMVEKGVPINQLIDAHDLPYDTSSMPWGNDWWIPMGQVPARFVLEGGLEAFSGPVLPEGQTDDEDETLPPANAPKEDEEKKSFEDAEKASAADRVWNRYIASFAPIEKAYSDQVRQYFRRQRMELVGKLKAALGESKSIKADANQIVARVVFDLVSENKKLRVINRIFFERASDLGIAQAESEVAGLKGEPLKDAVKRVRLSAVMRNSLQVSSESVSKVNAVSKKRIAVQLRQGLEAGEGLPELTDRIAGVLDTSHARANLIARTQVSGAVSSGRFAGMKDAGVEKKGWLTARDGAVRPDHKQAGIDYADGIPIDQPFKVGGDTLMYPGDPAGSAAQIANCRCMTIARLLAGGKTMNIADYDTVKILNHFEVKTLLSEV